MIAITFAGAVSRCSSSVLLGILPHTNAPLPPLPPPHLALLWTSTYSQLHRLLRRDAQWKKPKKKIEKKKHQNFKEKEKKRRREVGCLHHPSSFSLFSCRNAATPSRLFNVGKLWWIRPQSGRHAIRIESHILQGPSLGVYQKRVSRVFLSFFFYCFVFFFLLCYVWYNTWLLCLCLDRFLFFFFFFFFFFFCPSLFIDGRFFYFPPFLLFWWVQKLYV